MFFDFFRKQLLCRALENQLSYATLCSRVHTAVVQSLLKHFPGKTYDQILEEHPGISEELERELLSHYSKDYSPDLNARVIETLS